MPNVVYGPSYFIQNDWEEVLNRVAGEVWITCKYRNSTGKHGSIVRVNPESNSVLCSITATASFLVNPLTYNAIEVGQTNSDYRCIFVAPRSIFGNIHKMSITSFDVSESSVFVSVSSESECQVTISLAENQDKLRIFNEHVAPIYKCRWFPSGKVVLSCGADMCVKIWCSESGLCPVTLRGHTESVTDVAVVDSGRNIISVSKDGSCKLWDCGESRCLANILELPTPINCCSLSIASLNTLPEPIPQNGREIGTENKILILGCEDGTVCCVAVQSRKIIFKTQFQSAANCCCCIKPGLFAVGFQDGSIALLKAFSNNENHVVISWFETNSPALAALAYQGKGFFISHNDGSCIYRTVTDLNVPVRLCLTGPSNDPVYDICCDLKFVYTACRDSNIRKYSPDSYICRHFTEQNSKQVKN